MWNALKLPVARPPDRQDFRERVGSQHGQKLSPALSGAGAETRTPQQACQSLQVPSAWSGYHTSAHGVR